MRRAPGVLAVALLAACAGEARTEPQRPSPTVEAVEEPAPSSASAAAEEPETEEPSAPGEPRFDAPMPTEPCPEVAVRLAHIEHALPPLLGQAVAMRSADRQRVRVVLSDHALERDETGRFAPPPPGGARFEMDARRSRRGPLDPRVLGAPDAPRGGLTHVRVVTAETRLTFGHRDIGSVELTALEDDRVCGRIELDDGFTRVRGAFTAPVIGPFPP